MATDSATDPAPEAWSDEPLPPVMPRKKPREDAEMDITPMIDITFLLLIFFLVASKMEEGANVSLPPARHGSAVGTKESVILTVGKGDGDKAQIFKADGKITSEILKGADEVQQEEEIQQYVETVMEEENKAFVLIKAEKGVKHRDVARVAKAVGKIESVQQLFIAVLEVQ